MSVQGLLTGLVVTGAFVYLVWKLGLASRSRRRPDVPVSGLVRKGARRKGGSPPDKPQPGG